MKKLSRLLKEQYAEPTQSLVLFNGVLDGERLLHSPEIETLVNHFYGGLALTLAEVNDADADRLHNWARDEQYKADAQDHAMIYHVKAKFEDLVVDTKDGQFSGPLYVQVFRPLGFAYDVLTITCQWYDGLFRNDYYVIGVIADTADLDAIILQAAAENDDR